MRSILINKQIEDLSIEYSKNLFRSRRVNFEKPLVGLNKLWRVFRGRPTVASDYSAYIRMIIRLYKLLNASKPEKFDQLHLRFFGNFAVDLSKKFKISGKNQPFYAHITDAMRYDAVREKEFLPFAKKLGIRACVYCNTQYALSINHAGTDYGKFELDHFKAQSEFPYLCTNFFNLTPSCSNCNKYKSGKSVLFSLYKNVPTTLNPFTFKLDKQSVIKYMLSRDFNDLKIIFDHGLDPDHNTIFKIEATYSVLKDVVEEIIWKHKIYNIQYLKSLKDGFSMKFDKANFQRFILGNYTSPQDINKRPLAKLTQDIAKQLGILK